MTIYHPNIILKETRRQSAAEFFHRIFVEKKLIELMEKGRFSSYALKICRNLHQSIILRSVKEDNQISVNSFLERLSIWIQLSKWSER